MNPLTNAIKRSLALKIAIWVGFVMLILIGIMGIVVTKQQTDEHFKTMDDFLYTKAKLSSMVGAKTYGSFLDTLIDQNALSVEEAFDREYKLIEGYTWKKPKYHTKYDSLLDATVLTFIDSFLSDRDFIFAIGVDIEGYCPVHNSRYQQPLTGDPEKDNIGNRTKRIFDDPVGLAAAKNNKDGFRQEYKRDTGELIWDVASPIFVKGRHWGGFRVAVSMAKVEERAGAMVKTLVILFAAFIVVVLFVVFFLLKRAMGPVEKLTETADLISAGEALEKPIQVKSVDEIGRLAKSLDRLRTSMKAAMQRLGE